MTVKINVYSFSTIIENFSSVRYGRDHSESFFPALLYYNLHQQQRSMELIMDANFIERSYRDLTVKFSFATSPDFLAFKSVWIPLKRWHITWWYATKVLTFRGWYCKKNNLMFCFGLVWQNYHFDARGKVFKNQISEIMITQKIWNNNEFNGICGPNL